MQVFCIVNAQGGVQVKQSRLFKKAVHSAEGCSTATTIANTVIKQTLSMGYLNQKKKEWRTLEYPICTGDISAYYVENIVFTFKYFCSLTRVTNQLIHQTVNVVLFYKAIGKY